MYLLGAAQLSPRSGPLLQGFQEVSRKRPLQRGAFVATSAPEMGPPLPHLHRDLPTSARIDTGPGPIAATSASGLAHLCPHLHRDWAHRCHICTETARPVCVCRSATCSSATSTTCSPTTTSRSCNPPLRRAAVRRLHANARTRPCAHLHWRARAGGQAGRERLVRRCREGAVRTS